MSYTKTVDVAPGVVFKQSTLPVQTTQRSQPVPVYYIHIRLSMTERKGLTNNARAGKENGSIKNEFLAAMTFHTMDQSRAAVQQAATFYKDELPIKVSL